MQVVLRGSKKTVACKFKKCCCNTAAKSNRYVDHPLQHISGNKTKYGINFSRRFITLWWSLHLFQESSWSWQLKTWIAKLSYLKFLKKTLVTVFFFPSLKPWSNSTWFFCEFCYLYFYLLLLRQLGEQPIVVIKCEVSLFIRKFDIFIWAIKAFSRACNATCGTTQHNSTQHVALQVREKCF